MKVEPVTVEWHFLHTELDYRRGVRMAVLMDGSGKTLRLEHRDLLRWVGSERDAEQVHQLRLAMFALSNPAKPRA